MAEKKAKKLDDAATQAEIGKQVEQAKLVISKMRQYRVTIEGVGGLLCCRIPGPEEQAAEKVEKESHDARERRVWRSKLYYDETIGVYIPGENIQESLKDGCRYWGAKIPGEGAKTWTDVINSACIIEDMPLDPDTPMQPEDKRIVPYGRWVNGRGKNSGKGGSKVWRIRPLIAPWRATFMANVFDKRIEAELLRVIVTYAGKYKGLGDYRPKFGRYELVSIEEV